MELFDILSALTAANGVSGDEGEAVSAAADILKKIGYEPECSENSCVCYAGSEDGNAPLLLIDAHIDEIGMAVTYITDDGFIKAGECGGLDCRILPAQQVAVLGKEKLAGVVVSVPPHLAKDSSKATELSDTFIDIGMTKEQAEKAVSLGDRVVIENPLVRLAGSRVTSKALDNRAGAAAVIRAMEIIKDKSIQLRAAALFSSQEETGGSGAKTGAYSIAPDMAIAVDVSFAGVIGDKPEECGVIGKGPMIGISPSLSGDMSRKMISAAKRADIPYQTEVMPGRTGTNADHIGISGGGVKTVTVSIPIKHMHTPVETADLQDIENTARLIAAFIESAGEHNDR